MINPTFLNVMLMKYEENKTWGIGSIKYACVSFLISLIEIMTQIRFTFQGLIWKDKLGGRREEEKAKAERGRGGREQKSTSHLGNIISPTKSGSCC